MFLLFCCMFDDLLNVSRRLPEGFVVYKWSSRKLAKRVVKRSHALLPLKLFKRLLSPFIPSALTSLLVHGISAHLRLPQTESRPLEPTYVYCNNPGSP
jgi:hypothetical protein